MSFNFWSALRLCNSVFGALLMYFLLYFLSSFSSLAGGLLVFFCFCVVISGVTWFFFLSCWALWGWWLVCVVCVLIYLLLFSIHCYSWISLAGGMLVDFGGVLFVSVIVVCRL